MPVPTLCPVPCIHPAKQPLLAIHPGLFYEIRRYLTTLYWHVSVHQNQILWELHEQQNEALISKSFGVKHRETSQVRGSAALKNYLLNGWSPSYWNKLTLKWVLMTTGFFCCWNLYLQYLVVSHSQTSSVIGIYKAPCRYQLEIWDLATRDFISM